MTSYTVPVSSLPFWLKRFDAFNVKHGPIEERFGEPHIHFSHPGGLEFELIGDDKDQRPPWTTAEVSKDVAVRGLHSVTLSLREVAESEIFMGVLGFRKTARKAPIPALKWGGRFRMFR